MEFSASLLDGEFPFDGRSLGIAFASDEPCSPLQERSAARRVPDKLGSPSEMGFYKREGRFNLLRYSERSLPHVDFGLPARRRCPVREQSDRVRRILWHGCRSPVLACH